MKPIFIITIITLLNSGVKAQPGTLDYSFGDKGKVSSETYQGLAYSSLVQPDGKILVAGGHAFYYKEGKKIRGALLARYNTEGSLDLNFGDSGRAIYNLGDTNFTKIIYAIALQPDGKIVAAGQYAESGDDSRIAVMRFNADGSIDEGFGNEGLTVTALSNYFDIVRDMALLPDGRIVVTGDLEAGINDNYRSFIVCYTPEGFLDEKFGNKGIAIIELNKAMDINAIAVTTNDKIIVGGYYRLSVKNILLRYNNDGSIDRSFGDNGLAELPFEKTVLNSLVKDITLTADNKIVTAGYVYFKSGITAIAVSRFTENGMPDSSFGTNAYSINKYKDGDAFANGMAIQDNGKIIAGGYFLKGESAVFTITRFTDKGLIDSSFGDNGIQNTNFYASDIGYSLALQKDGQIVLAGNSILPYPNVRSVTDIARYNGDKTQQQTPITRIKRWLRKHGFTWENWPRNNIASYSVQRSSNGVNWTTIFNRRATGSSQQIMANSSFQDPAPLNGTNYYRLQTTSTDGAIAYSNITAITNSAENAVSISPNPARNNLRIESLPEGSKTTLMVVDLSGNIKLQAVANSKTYNLNIASLKAGNYLLKIETNGEMIAKKFMKE